VSAAEPELVAGEVDPRVAEEFPELRLWLAHYAVVPGKSPEGVKERLRTLSDRFRGPEAVAMRTKPIPWAYRVFFRHIGIDPDSNDSRTPLEALAIERLRAGHFRSNGLVDDALVLATMETGVPLWAANAAAVGDLGISVGPGGKLAIVSGSEFVTQLFDPVPEPFAVSKGTREIVVFAVAVGGVPDIHVEEAVWQVGEVLDLE
jgi:hypothetical protein